MRKGPALSAVSLETDSEGKRAMDHARQVEILKSLIHQLDTKTTVDAGVQMRMPTSDYVCPDLANQEWEAFFRTHVQVIGLSGDLPEANSFFTMNDFGVPVLAMRGPDGTFRAFINACRHRGVQLASEGRGITRLLTCPFHAWSYATDGKLIAVPNEDLFGDVDKSCHGLIELPAAEKYGLLFVHPQPDGQLDVDAFLGPLADELALQSLETQVFCGETTIDKNLNWKLANDTFGETYHFKTLHKNTLAQNFHGDTLHYETIGKHHRFTFARRTIDEIRTLPEVEWDLFEGALVLYYLFPNIQLIRSDGRVTLVKIYPHPTEPGRSISQILSYFTKDMIAKMDAAQAASKSVVSTDNVYEQRNVRGAIITIEAIMEVFNSTIEHEDYLMGEQQQRAAESGLVTHSLFGRNEPALHHYHNTFREALGRPALEAVQG